MNEGVFVYRKEFTNPGAVTLLQLRAPALRPLMILRASITQRSSTTSAFNGAILVRKSAGATVTAAIAADVVPVNPNSAAHGLQLGAAATGHTATAEGTDGVILDGEGFNVLNGYLYFPTPELQSLVPADGIVGLKLLTAFTGTLVAEIHFKPLG